MRNGVKKMTTELLAPAGNLKKLKFAFLYGADAVYLGGKSFSLRSFAENFTPEELEEGIRYAHERGKKVYVAANIFARNGDFPALREHLGFLGEVGADGVLVSDPGVLALAREVSPSLPIHISTQANVTNAEAANFWFEAGAKRVVLARELSVPEISEIHARVPGLELEAFVHGAMCISYSGRCYLSDYMDGRTANRGACVQACRRQYRVQAIGEDGEFYDAEEDGHGAYILNSKDLNMSAHLEALASAGVCSFKIEGRMKGEYYLATVVNAYRRLMDGGDANLLGEELETAPHRAYTTAYAMQGGGNQSCDTQLTQGSCDFIAIVLGMKEGIAEVEMRGRFKEGDVLEIVSPSDSFGKQFSVQEMRDQNGEPCHDAKLVQAHYFLPCPYPLSYGDLLRRRR